MMRCNYSPSIINDQSFKKLPTYIYYFQIPLLSLQTNFCSELFHYLSKAKFSLSVEVSLFLLSPEIEDQDEVDI
jgi:hypothetical protein